jgi:hypothetical protein
MKKKGEFYSEEHPKVALWPEEIKIFLYLFLTFVPLRVLCGEMNGDEKDR